MSELIKKTVDWELWVDREGVYELHDLTCDESITIEPYDDADQIFILISAMEKHLEFVNSQMEDEDE